MFRMICEKDIQSLLSYLLKEPELNKLLIENIKKFGYNSNECKIGIIEKNEKFELLLSIEKNRGLIYSHYYKDMSKSDINWIEIIDKLKEKIGTNNSYRISGASSNINILSSKLDYKNKEELEFYFQVCKRLNPEFDKINLNKVRIAGKNDIEKISKLYENADDKDAPPIEIQIEQLETIINGKLNGSVSYIMDENTGNAISSASRVLEDDNTCVIVAVVTHPYYRRKGYAANCVYKLTEEIIEKGKTAYLTYLSYNPAAGNSYKHVGFVEYTMWKMLMINS